jgi:uncharacterized membrane protein
MNKEIFLYKLSRNLKSLPREEVDDIMMDFEEYFEVGMERGRTEQEVASSLGDPGALAKQIRAESYIKKAEETASTGNITRAVFTTIGLSFFNIIFILPIFLAVFAVVLALFAVSIAISAAGITGMIGSFFYPLYAEYLTFVVNPVVGIFAFLGLGALGILFFTGNIYLWKYMYRGIVKYLRFNLSVIRGRRKQDEV